MLQHGQLTETILEAFYRVHNTLGHGFLEKVYENALIMEHCRMGLKAAQQRPIRILYNGHEIGDYFADVIVEDLVIRELKAAALWTRLTKPNC